MNIKSPASTIQLSPKTTKSLRSISHLPGITASYLILLCIYISLSTGCATQNITTQGINDYGVDQKTHSAITPAHRYNWWGARHNQVLDRVKQGNVDLILVGDSITHGWEKSGKKMWDKYYAPRNAVNMGFGGDRTQHVLWRFDHGEIDGISPKLAVLMIGTNNSNGQDNTAEEIADGIKLVCATMRAKLPETKILILAIFPRGAKPSPQRQKNDTASKLASQIADNDMIYYLNINDKFLQKDGTLTKEIMPDLLHPKEKGYKIWAQAIEPTVVRLMGEK